MTRTKNAGPIGKTRPMQLESMTLRKRLHVSSRPRPRLKKRRGVPTLLLEITERLTDWDSEHKNGEPITKDEDTSIRLLRRVWSRSTNCPLDHDHCKMNMACPIYID